jgi:hypothetical protein
MIRFGTKSKWVVHAALVVAAGVFFVSPRGAAAQTPPASAPPAPAAAAPAASTEIGALVDAYYDYYSTKPTGNAPFRNFDTLHNQFAFSMAEVWLTKAPTADSRVGFKLKLNFGPATSNFIHSTEPGGTPYQNIQEAYASYLAPAGKGLQLDAGVFVTPAGAEVIEAKDNMNYSRGLLFSLAIPYYHSGVRATYTVNDKVTLMGGVVNGWNNIVENNSGKTGMGAVTFKPTSMLTLVENYLVGPEQPDTTDTVKRVRNLSDTIVTYTPTSALTLTANYDYAHDTVGTAGVHWQGIAGYLKYQATKYLAVSPRFEIYDDASGVTTGTVQKLKEFTGTLELKAADSFLWRIEYRGDWSDKTPFTGSDGKPTGNQQSIGFGVLYSFSGKIQ